MRKKSVVMSHSSALSEVSRDADKDWAVVLEHSEYLIEYWKPTGPDVQDTHEQDEFYFIIAGKACVDLDGERSTVGAGDIIFVPAGVWHRFSDQSRDLEMWILFTEQR